MPLDSYRKKRKFDETPEPQGKLRRSGKKHIFVVQKHAASHLHYDFRLEINGVLVSWAVPKGPTMDPSSKRFATMTEDHPVEYADFEGTIPEGHYGAGTVMVWDKGTYQAEEEIAPEQQLDRGELKIELQGKKLRGTFVLVQMGHRRGKPQEKSRWLLIKRKDQWVDSKWKVDTRTLNRSVLSDRTLQEIEHVRPKKRPHER